VAAPVWHVDENMEDNDNERHYKVALMQADGKNELATESDMDSQYRGDPFPGATHNTTFNANSNPNSRSYYRRKDTSVSVTGISDSAEMMTMDVTVKPRRSPPKSNL